MDKQLRNFGCLALVSALSASAFGLEYTLQPELEARATHNDNIRLSPVNPISLQGREVRTGFESQVAAETWQTEFNVDLRFNNYNREEFDSDDQFVDFNVNRDGERYSLGFTSNVVRDSTRTSEDDTTGIVGLEAQRRELYAVSPYWRYQVTDTNRLELSGSLSRQKYDTGNARYADYDYAVLSANWFTVVSENLTLQLDVTGTSYETDPRETTIVVGGQLLEADDTEYTVKSDALKVRIGGEYRVTENITLNALIGTVETDQQYDVKDDPPGICDPGIFIGNFFLIGAVYIPPTQCAIEDFNERTETGEVSLTGEGERSDWSVGYSIANQPTSQGYEVESEEVSIDWGYALTERSNLKFNVLYGQVEAVDVASAALNASNSNRDFVNSSLVYSYRLTEEWRVFSDFRYRWQEREVAVGDAESYAIGLGIKYKPAKTIWSR